MLIILLPFLSSCWNQTEIDRLAIVTTTGVDYTRNGKIMMSVEVIVPRSVSSGSYGSTGGGRSGGNTKIVRSASGETIASAMANLQKKFPRKLFLGQNEVLVIGKSMAKHGILGQFDFISRQPEARLGIFPFYFDGSAKKMLAVNPPLEVNLTNVLKNEALLEVKKNLTANDILQTMGSEAAVAILPWIHMNEDNSAPFIKGRAIFKNGRLIGTAGPTLTKGIIWVRNEIKQTTIDIQLPGDKRKLASSLIKSKTKITPVKVNGKWVMKVNVKIIDDIVENKTSKDLGNPKIISMVQTAVQNKVKRNIEKALAKAQNDWKADIFGFNEIFHQKYPKEWEKQNRRWNQFFTKLTFDTNVHVKIERTGLNSSPPGIPRKGR
ncbi:MAG TPA: Ger(x)C family spore germination protein [Bacillales bacterium]|nr:Ger(x)C family spore germination protein [Bacillales bacterium]